MPITTTCPQCQARVEISDDLADQPICCQRCLHTFERDGKPEAPAGAIQAGAAPKVATSKPRKEEDAAEPRPSPRRPTARPAFPWTAVLIVTIGILFFLLVMSIGFNIWFITSPDAMFRRADQIRAEEARQQAMQAQEAAERARQMQQQAEGKEAQLQRRIDELQRQVDALKEQVEDGKKK